MTERLPKDEYLAKLSAQIEEAAEDMWRALHAADELELKYRDAVDLRERLIAHYQKLKHEYYYASGEEYGY